MESKYKTLANNRLSIHIFGMDSRNKFNRSGDERHPSSFPGDRIRCAENYRPRR